MGILSDFFIATQNDLERALPGWQLPPLPLPEPVVIGVVNPFTNERIERRTRLDHANQPKPNPDAAPDPNVYSLPHVLCKGMLPDKLAVVLSALSGIDVDDAIDLILCGSLVGPPETNSMILRLPREFVQGMANAGPDTLVRVAKALEDDSANVGELFRVPSSEFLEVLSELSALVEKGQSDGADLFIHMCP